MFLFHLISAGSIPDKISSSTVGVDVMQPPTNRNHSLLTFFAMMALAPYWTAVFVKLAHQWLLASLFSRLQRVLTFAALFSKCWW